MSDLRMIFVLWSREILRMTKEPSRLLGMLIQPMLFWWIIGSGFMPSFHAAENSDLNYQNFFFVGILAMVVLFSAIFSTMTLIEDKASGFMQAILVAPGSRLALVIGKILGIANIALLQAVLLIGVAYSVGFPLGEADWFLVLFFLFLGAVALSGLGFLFAWGTSSTAAYHALMSVILIPLWIVSGAMFPPQVYWMKVVLLVNPIAWLVAGLRAAFSGGVAPIGSVIQVLNLQFCATLLLGFSFLMILICAWISRKN